jgi:hypothetical protein
MHRFVALFVQRMRLWQRRLARTTSVGAGRSIGRSTRLLHKAHMHAKTVPHTKCAVLWWPADDTHLCHVALCLCIPNHQRRLAGRSHSPTHSTGLIMWQKTRRGVPLDKAAAIAAAAKAGGAQAVGVFVDESAAEIKSRCVCVHMHTVRQRHVLVWMERIAGCT